MASAYDLSTKIEDVIGVNIQAITTNTTTVGSIRDTALFESLVAILQVGARTDGTYALKFEHGDDSALADAADVPSDELVGSLPSIATANTIGSVGYVGKKRYVRLSIVSTGVTTGATAGALLVKGDPRHQA